MRDDILEHLRFLAEIGVAGPSRDPSWRRRSGDPLGPAADDDRPETDASVGPEEPGPSGLGHGADAPAVVAAEEEPSDTERGLEQGPEHGLERRPDLGLEQGPGAEVVDERDTNGRAVQAVRAELGECTRCKLHGHGRKQIVFGVGNPDADLLFVGEAPGQDEDRQGVPFVGRAGQLLNKIIESIGLTREDVYIANVIKCRPPQNRNPEPDEVEQCEPFLFAQVDAIQAKVIVSLGKFATQALLRSSEPISRLRGRVYDYRGARLIPTFHPAYLLRNPSSKREVWEDMKKVRALLQEE